MGLFVFFLERGFLVYQSKAFGFVISGAAVLPTSKEPQRSWTTHPLLLTEEQRTSRVGEILALFMALRHSLFVRF